MLSGVDSFDGDVSQWDVSAVNSMYEMFAYSDKFNSDLSQWDVSSVTSMNKMFTYASAFKGDISKWDLSSVNNMDKIFYGITISKKNYDALLLAWGEQTLQRYVKGPDVENL
jgi:surface protein